MSREREILESAPQHVVEPKTFQTPKKRVACEFTQSLHMKMIIVAWAIMT